MNEFIRSAVKSVFVYAPVLFDTGLFACLLTTWMARA
jgi:hypothetical protein